MRRALAVITLDALCFIVLLSVSGALGGVLSKLVYYLAFFLPAIIIFAVKRRTGLLFHALKPLPDKRKAVLFVPTVCPVIILVFAVSYLTSLLLTGIGAEQPSKDLSGNVFTVLFTHALLPAILEELLFRYAFLGILLPYSKRGAIIFSAAFFAFAHCNLFQLPYAFIAGLLFAFIDVFAESILPSVLLHFVNNMLSIFWVRQSQNLEFKTVFLIMLGVAGLISAVVLFIFRHHYKDSGLEIVREKRKITPSAEVIVFFIIAFLLSLAVI